MVQVGPKLPNGLKRGNFFCKLDLAEGKKTMQPEEDKQTLGCFGPVKQICGIAQKMRRMRDYVEHIFPPTPLLQEWAPFRLVSAREKAKAGGASLF
jgi:hypothetical protein